jgi:histidine ammonia-lyase
VISIDDREVSLDTVVAVAAGARVEPSASRAWRRRMAQSRRVLDDALAAGATVYGVSTGVGNNSSRAVGLGEQIEFAISVMEQHGCGTGEPLSEAEGRAVTFARVVSLSKGLSAIRPELIDALCALLNHGITPVIPRWGSVGASGDLTPLSYVAAVVSAYRLVLDAAPGEEQAAVAQARRSLRQALGRKPTHGFLVAEERREVITPQRVGASGQLAAAVERVQGDAMSLRLRVPLAAGDRLRLDSDEGFEKKAFRLREMSLKGRPVTTAEAGALVRVPRVRGARAGDRLFRTDIRMAGVSTSSAKLRRRLWQETATPPRFVSPPALAERLLRLPPPPSGRSDRPVSLYLRLDDHRLLGAALEAGCQVVLLQATPETLRRLSSFPRQQHLWLALPPVIHERELSLYREQVPRHQELGHNRWVVANWGHFPLFDRPPEMLLADLTFNVLNSQAAFLLHEVGCQGMILSLENDRANLQHLVRLIGGLNPLLTV